MLTQKTVRERREYIIKTIAKYITTHRDRDGKHGLKINIASIRNALPHQYQGMSSFIGGTLHRLAIIGYLREPATNSKSYYMPPDSPLNKRSEEEVQQIIRMAAYMTVRRVPKPSEGNPEAQLLLALIRGIAAAEAAGMTEVKHALMRALWEAIHEVEAKWRALDSPMAMVLEEARIQLKSKRLWEAAQTLQKLGEMNVLE